MDVETPVVFENAVLVGMVSVLEICVEPASDELFTEVEAVPFIAPTDSVLTIDVVLAVTEIPDGGGDDVVARLEPVVACTEVVFEKGKETEFDDSDMEGPVLRATLKLVRDAGKLGVVSADDCVKLVLFAIVLDTEGTLLADDCVLPVSLLLIPVPETVVEFVSGKGVVTEKVIVDTKVITVADELFCELVGLKVPIDELEVKDATLAKLLVNVSETLISDPVALDKFEADTLEVRDRLAVAPVPDRLVVFDMVNGAELPSPEVLKLGEPVTLVLFVCEAVTTDEVTVTIMVMLADVCSDTADELKVPPVERAPEVWLVKVNGAEADGKVESVTGPVADPAVRETAVEEDPDLVPLPV